MSDEVLVSAEDGVLVVTINRPEARNAMTKAASEAIAAAMDRLDAELELRCAILTGAGGTFCSGMDLKGFLAGELPVAGDRGFGGLTAWTPNKPIIAAVDGFALAGGMELALSCDMIVANVNAKFGVPEVKRGLVAAGGGVIQLPRLLPRPLAMELALTGDPLPAQRAFELGLVNRVVDGPALEGARELAETIAANVAKAPNLTTLVKALQAAGLSDTLAGPGPFTLLAPTNDAFGRLQPGTVDTLLKPENKPSLAKLLRYHIVAGRITTKELRARIAAGGGSTTLTSLQGDPLTVTLTSDVLTLNDVNGNRSYIQTGDVPQSNGLIQVVNGVLIPDLG